MKHCKARHSLQQDVMKSKKNKSTNREISCHFAHSKKKASLKRKGKKSTIHFLKKGDQEGDEALQSKTLASTRRNEKQKKQIN